MNRFAELLHLLESTVSNRSVGITHRRRDIVIEALRTALALPVRVHHFDSTGSAYDACQCDEQINDGDILLIPSEGVVGIADTWPVAVTEKRGNLHSLVEGAALEEHFADKPRSLAAIPFARAFAQAVTQ